MSEQTVRPRLSPTEAMRIRVNLMRVAALAAVLGLLMEAILVVGGSTTATLSSLLDNGLWPFLVCMAVAVGQAVSGGWPPRAGIFSLIATPTAFSAVKVLQKALSGMLGQPAVGPLVSGPLLEEAVLRGLEYTVLAAALVWLVRQTWAGALAHLGFGLVIGALFGLLIAFFLPPDSFLGFIVEELVFPAGCALIVFASETLKQLMPEDAASNAAIS